MVGQRQNVEHHRAMDRTSLDGIQEHQACPAEWVTKGRRSAVDGDSAANNGNIGRAQRASLIPSQGYHNEERLSITPVECGTLRRSIANCQAALWLSELGGHDRPNSRDAGLLSRPPVEAGRSSDESVVQLLVTRALQKALLIHGEEVRRGPSSAAYAS